MTVTDKSNVMVKYESLNKNDKCMTNHKTKDNRFVCWSIAPGERTKVTLDPTKPFISYTLWVLFTVIAHLQLGPT